MTFCAVYGQEKEIKVGVVNLPYIWNIMLQIVFKKLFDQIKKETHRKHSQLLVWISFLEQV